jgi:ATP-binding cassette subfamily C protein LapB
MDEPTASMDTNTELETLKAFKEAIKPEDTLILVTHKPSLLSLAACRTTPPAVT